ncbi:hypothetical protein CR513_20640, partial [Mucuna pruriens]
MKKQGKRYAKRVNRDREGKAFMYGMDGLNLRTNSLKKGELDTHRDHDMPTKNEIHEGRKRHANTWPDLKREMRTRFVLVSYTRDLYNKLQRMYQGSKSVEQYHRDMEVALTRANVLESSEPLWFEKVKERPIRDKSPKKESLLTLGRKEEGKLPNPPPTSKSNSFKSLGKGHIALHYLNKRNMVLLEDGISLPIIKSDASCEYSSDEEEDLLMLRRQLCSIIIDGGNSVNIASTRLVSLAFIVEQYKDGVLPDVYDRKVTDDWVTNRFTFIHKVQKVILKPLSHKEVKKDQAKMKLRREQEKKRREKKKCEKIMKDGASKGIKHHMDDRRLMSKG